jgi:membrane protease YdiL (CAAX protease family)
MPLGLAMAVLAMCLGDKHWGRACILLIVAPCTEEIIFRAGLQESLLQGGLSRHASNLATALAFALAHLALQHTMTGLAVALPALLIGEVYGRTRRLGPCIVLHAGMNAVWMFAS